MNIFTKEEVKESTLKFFNNDQLATVVWMKKYALKNKKGEFVELSPYDRYLAISKDIVEMDKKYDDFETLTVETVMELLLDKKFLFGGSILYGAANSFSTVSLSNCFVISGNEEDSYGSIFKNDQEIAQISKRRGGTGLDISHLRAKYFSVNNAAESSTGPVSFAERFSNTTREVAQDGRRGALMLSMHVNHLDILDFITMKDNDTKVTGANVSVRITDEFMKAVISDGVHQLRYPVDSPTIYAIKEDTLLNHMYHTAYDASYMNVKARDVFNKLVEVNHRRAEPGALFWDTIIRESPADCYAEFKTESTNPCGELPLSPYDSCRLTSINLTAHVLNPFTSRAKFDMHSFKRTVKIVTRIMDNIVDLEIDKVKSIIEKISNDPESEQTKAIELVLWNKVLNAAIQGRRLGISIIGHADMLAMLSMQYGDTDSNLFLGNVHRNFATFAYNESARLAEVRGNFPAFIAALDKNSFLNRIKCSGIPRRNIALLTIPPSGSLSILLDNQSSGVEPVFALWYTRKRKVTDAELFDFVDATGDKFMTYPVFHPNFIKWAKVEGISLIELERDPEKYAKLSPWNGCTSEEIDPLSKVKMLGIIQKYIDHSISSTHNLKESATLKDVEDIYIEAWKNGLKGVTVYRSGSRAGILNTKVEVKTVFDTHDAPKRPRDLNCDIYHPTINGEKYIVMVGLMDGKPYEVFALKKKDSVQVAITITKGIIRKQKSKHWKLLTSDEEILVENILEEFEVPENEFATKMISTALRHGAAIDFVVDQLNDTDGLITDYAKVIARQLKKYTKGLSAKIVEAPCPICGEAMKVESGCSVCINQDCGYSACS